MPPKKASKPAGKKTAAAAAKKKKSPAPKKASAPKAKAPASPKKAAASPVKKAKAGGGSTIVIEYCKQCQCFKKRAELLQEHLNKIKGPGLKFSLNPEKPTKGAFIVKGGEKGDTTLFSITGLTRPFAPLKALDFAEVAKEVAAKL